MMISLVRCSILLQVYQTMFCVTIYVMTEQERKYLQRSCRRLAGMLPVTVDALMKWYGRNEDAYSVEEIGSYVYCLFSFPVTTLRDQLVEKASDLNSGALQRIIVLVYEGSTIIADCSALHDSLQPVLFSQADIDYICTESDWMFLEHYALSVTSFPDLSYPPRMREDMKKIQAEAVIFANAYVTASYRRQGIFANMIQMVKDFVLQDQNADTELYSVIALDPDIACYGPDAVDEPYIYSYEKDEPLRERNRIIMKKIGYTPVKLEELASDNIGDGAKLWFAVCHEKDWIREPKEKQS